MVEPAADGLHRKAAHQPEMFLLLISDHGRNLNRLRKQAELLRLRPESDPPLCSETRHQVLDSALNGAVAHSKLPCHRGVVQPISKKGEDLYACCVNHRNRAHYSTPSENL